MKQEQALQIIVQVCEKSNKAGVFSLSESHLVLKALEQFGIKPPEVDNINDEAEVVETKDKKD
tara:strand:- start:1657 stop:1845 length:189 start_codon:yes stop_codon:yes gene_type:complete